MCYEGVALEMSSNMSGDACVGSVLSRGKVRSCVMHHGLPRESENYPPGASLLAHCALDLWVKLKPSHTKHPISIVQ